MPEQEFKEWYDWVKQRTEEYQAAGLRTSVITGFFSAKSREVFTGEQVLQLLELRYPEEKSTCIGWGATGA